MDKKELKTSFRKLYTKSGLKQICLKNGIQFSERDNINQLINKIIDELPRSSIDSLVSTERLNTSESNDKTAAPAKNRFDSLKNFAPLTGYITAFAAIITICTFGYKNCNSIFKKEKTTNSPCTFDSTLSEFKILILKFDKRGENNVDFGIEINERLTSLSLRDSLHIKSLYCDAIEYPTHKYIDSILTKTNSNLIIYGKYGDCEVIGKNEICYNWKTDSAHSKTLDTLEQQISTKYHKDPKSIVDIANGELQGGTDFIAYFFTAQSLFSQKKFSKAYKYSKFIYDSLEIRSYNFLEFHSKLGFFASDFYNYIGRDLLDASRTQEDSVQAFLTISTEYSNSSNYLKSIEIIDSAFLFFPNNPVLYIRKANAVKDRNPQAALNIYKKIKYLYEHNNLSLLNPNYVEACYNMGEIYYTHLKNYTKAKEILLQVESLLVQHKDKDIWHKQWGIIQHRIAACLQRIGDYTSLKNAEQRLLDNKKYIGSNKANMSRDYGVLALIYLRLNDLQAAEKYTEYVLKIGEEIYSNDHEDLGTEYYNAAWVYFRSEKLDLALEYSKKAYQIDLKQFGVNHERTIESVSLYTTLLVAKNNKKEAVSISNYIKQHANNYYKQQFASKTLNIFR